MKFYIALFTCLFSLSLSAVEYEPNIVYFQVDEQTLSFESLSQYPAIAEKYNVTKLELPFFGTPALERTYRIWFANTELIDDLVSELEQLPFVNYAEKAPMMKISDIPNDLIEAQWNLVKIKANEAWDIETGDPTLRIAIVDNAVSTVHQDLVQNFTVGRDVSDGDNDPNPPSNFDGSSPFQHGTFVAGVATATTNNGNGIASIGRNVKYMAVKCSPDNSASEGNSLPNAYDGVQWAMQNGADIINMSWGGTGGIFITGQAVIELALAQGIVLIAAAGNDNSDEDHFPAAYNGVISVGSTNREDVKSTFSNFGSTIDVMAPGSDIFSTTLGNNNNGYRSGSGTSFSAPLVSGLAGLILSANPNFSVNQVRDRLRNTADDISAVNPDFEGELGAGRINAHRALDPSLPPTPVEKDTTNDDPIANINLIERNDGLKVFPNPTNGKVNILWQEALFTELFVFNAQGALIYNVNTTDAVELSALQPGMYWVKAQGPKFVATQPLVVQ